MIYGKPNDEKVKNGSSEVAEGIKGTVTDAKNSVG